MATSKPSVNLCNAALNACRFATGRHLSLKSTTVYERTTLMANTEFLNRIALCLSKLQAERNDQTMSRRQRHAEQALFKAWLKEDPASFDNVAYDRAKEALQHYVRSQAGQGMLRRMSTTRFIRLHLRYDGSEPWAWLHDAIEEACDPLRAGELLKLPRSKTPDTSAAQGRRAGA